jgi:uncharacterized protein (TIGR03437 family)
MAAGLCPGAGLYTGQGARLIIGQPTFTAQLPDSSDTVIGGAGGLAYANGTLVIADANRVAAFPVNNRVLIFNNIVGSLPSPTGRLPQGGRCPVCVGQANVVLGQANFNSADIGLSQNALRLPTAVATDGVRLVVADTDNNRVLIWNRIPQTNAAPADLVLGQPDFKTGAPNSGTGDARVPSAKSLKGPQGVWIQNGKLFVSDDLNNRVLIWNSFPTSNFQPASVVLGAPNFSTAIEPDLTKATLDASATTLLNPVSVSSDGVRLFVTDLGHNRVLIWNTIPTQNQVPADVVIGQPDMTTAIANYGYSGLAATSSTDANGKTTVTTTSETPVLCPVSDGTDANNVPTYPAVCGATLNYPRFALSDGRRLFIADGGNDRVLIFNTIPTKNAVSADAVLGQINDQLVQTSDDSTNPDSFRASAADAIRTPTSLAWDGANLYVAEPFSRRVLVFTDAPKQLDLTAVRNAASLEIFALGTVTLGGTITAGDSVTITIQSKDYKYTVSKDDTISTVLTSVVDLINANGGDPNVVATGNQALSAVILTSRMGGADGNKVTLASSISSNASITASTSGSTLTGGQYAARLAPGTVISILGDGLADGSADAPTGVDPLPQSLAGVEVYVDGIRLPLLHVSPTEIRAQLPWEVNDATSSSAYVRITRSDGSVTATSAVGVPVVPQNPGIFALPGTDPRQGIVYHASSNATGTVLIDGTAAAGDIVSISIGPADNERTYAYTLTASDTLETARDALIQQINDNDPQVLATGGGMFSRVRLRARIAGPEGNGIPYKTLDTGGNVIMTATNSVLCCANVAGALVTQDNPAIPGETIYVIATGLGFLTPPDATFALATGFTYKGPAVNVTPRVDSLAGNKTANVLFSGAIQGTVGLYEVDLELNTSLATNPATQLTISQDIYTSNVVTFAVVNPNPSATLP